VQRYSILPKQQTYSKKNKWGESYIPALSIYNSRGKSQEDGIGEGEVKEKENSKQHFEFTPQNSKFYFKSRQFLQVCHGTLSQMYENISKVCQKIKLGTDYTD